MTEPEWSWCADCGKPCPKANEHPGQTLLFVEPTVMAQRLGVARERLTLEIVAQPKGGEAGIAYINILIDGEDLTPEQEKISGAYISECMGGPAWFPKPGNA